MKRIKRTMNNSESERQKGKRWRGAKETCCANSGLKINIQLDERERERERERDSPS